MDDLWWLIVGFTALYSPKLGKVRLCNWNKTFDNWRTTCDLYSGSTLLAMVELRVRPIDIVGEGDS